MLGPSVASSQFVPIYEHLIAAPGGNETAENGPGKVCKGFLRSLWCKGIGNHGTSRSRRDLVGNNRLEV